MKTKTGIKLIAEERQRQIEVEDWTSEYDATHTKGELASLGALYAYPGNRYEHRTFYADSFFSAMWPQSWDPKWWKPVPNNRIKELTKAGALIAAEIDRLQRID